MSNHTATFMDGKIVREENAFPDDFEFGEFLIVRTDRNVAWSGQYHGESPRGLFLYNARRLMPELVAAMTISNVVADGVKIALPPVVPFVRVTGVIEVLKATEAAQRSIIDAPVYRLDKPEVPFHAVDPRDTYGP